MGSLCPLTGQQHTHKRISFYFLSKCVIIFNVFIHIFFRHHQQPNGSLLAGPLTKADSGWFLCVATRERERDHRYIYLSVSGNVARCVHLTNIIKFSI